MDILSMQLPEVSEPQSATSKSSQKNAMEYSSTRHGELLPYSTNEEVNEDEISCLRRSDII